MQTKFLPNDDHQIIDKRVKINNASSLSLTDSSFSVLSLEEKQFLLEKNQHLDTLIQLILNYEQVCTVFLEHDLINLTAYYKDEAALESFIRALLEQADKVHVERSSLLSKYLIHLDTQIRSRAMNRNENQALLLSLLVNHIDYSQVPQQWIEPLMSFFCHHYYEDSYSFQESKVLVNVLIKLWHKAQTFDIPISTSSFNRPLACMILSHVYKTEAYHLNCSTHVVSASDLGLLIATYESNRPFSAQAKQQLSSKITFEIKTKTTMTSHQLEIMSLLARLNRCIGLHLITSTEQPTQHFFSLMQKTLASLDALAGMEPNPIDLFDTLCTNADLVLKAAERLGLFAMPLNRAETQLAQTLQQKTMSGLQQWIEQAELLQLTEFNIPQIGS